LESKSVHYSEDLGTIRKESGANPVGIMRKFKAMKQTEMYKRAISSYAMPSTGISTNITPREIPGETQTVRSEEVEQLVESFTNLDALTGGCNNENDEGDSGMYSSSGTSSSLALGIGGRASKFKV